MLNILLTIKIAENDSQTSINRNTHKSISRRLLSTEEPNSVTFKEKSPPSSTTS